MADPRGEPDPTRENTSPEGKASAVQFIRFGFTREQTAAFKTPGTQVVIGFDHPNYPHMAALSEPVRSALAEDFDYARFAGKRAQYRRDCVVALGSSQ